MITGFWTSTIDGIVYKQCSFGKLTKGHFEIEFFEDYLKVLVKDD